MSLDFFTGLDQLTSEFKGSSSLPSRVMLTGMCHWNPALLCVLRTWIWVFMFVQLVYQLSHLPAPWWMVSYDFSVIFHYSPNIFRLSCNSHSSWTFRLDNEGSSWQPGTKLVRSNRGGGSWLVCSCLLRDVATKPETCLACPAGSGGHANFSMLWMETFPKCTTYFLNFHRRLSGAGGGGVLFLSLLIIFFNALNRLNFSNNSPWIFIYIYVYMCMSVYLSISLSVGLSVYLSRISCSTGSLNSFCGQGRTLPLDSPTFPSQVLGLQVCSTTSDSQPSLKCAAGVLAMINSSRLPGANWAPRNQRAWTLCPSPAANQRPFFLLRHQFKMTL